MDINALLSTYLGWILLLASFFIFPLFLTVMKKWFLVTVQTFLIVIVAMLVLYTNLNGIVLSDNTALLSVHYASIGLFISVGAYGVIDALFLSNN